MLIITLLITFALVFLAGFHWCAWKVDKHKPSLYWSLFCGGLGVFHMISIVGQTVRSAC